MILPWVGYGKADRAWTSAAVTCIHYQTEVPSSSLPGSLPLPLLKTDTGRRSAWRQSGEDGK